MRGDDKQQLDVFSYVSPEQRIPQAGIRTMSSPFDFSSVRLKVPRVV
jgi:hypothetical protein